MSSTSGTHRRGSSLAHRAMRIFRHGILAVLAIGWILPLYVVVLNAFKLNDAIVSAPFGYGHLSLHPILNAIRSPTFNIFHGYVVTAVLVVIVNVGSVILCSPGAYVLARRSSRIYRIILMYLFAGAFIPGVVILIPLVYVLRNLGLQGTVAGLVLSFITITIPISMFAYVPYISSIPEALDEAARIDGAGMLRTFWRIIFPLMRPAVVTVIILNTTGIWENFIYPYIILGPGSGWQPVTTSIYGAIGPYSTDYSVVYPNLLLVIGPLVAFYAIIQRHLIAGLTAGAVQG